MNFKKPPEKIHYYLFLYALMFLSLFFSSNGTFYDLGMRVFNRIGIVLLLIVCSGFIIMLFVRTQKNFFKAITFHGIATLVSTFVMLVQLSGGVLWGFYFPLMVLISFRSEKKKALAGFSVIAFAEISSSVFSNSGNNFGQDYNPLSLRLIQLVCLFATVELFHRIFVFRKPSVRQREAESAFLPPLERIIPSKKIISRNVSNILGVIFSNPNVRTVVLLFIENSIEGTVFKIFDFRSSAADFIDASKYVKYSGSLLSIAAREPKYFLSRNFTGAAFNLGYYTDDVAVKSFCASPVRIGEETVGLLCVDSDVQEAFSEETAFDVHRYSLILSEIIQISSHLEKKEIASTFLEIINDLADKFVRSIYFKDVIEIFTVKLRETFNYEDFLIVLVDKYSVVTHTKSGNNIFFCDRLGTDFSLSPRSIARLVIKKNISLNETNFQKNTSVSRFILHPDDGSVNVMSFLAAPVPSKEEPCGAVFLMSNYLNNYEKKDSELLEVFARLLGAAISRAKLYEEKERLSLKDGLTGLYNHRYFQELLDEEISRCSRTTSSLSLLIMDIDFFKKINDAFGHRTGDTVLTGISSYLANSVRKFDSVARYGGEELTVILPECPYKEAVMISEKLRQGIESLEWQDQNGVPFKVTVSIGVSSYPLRAQTKEDLIEDADESLYSAKEGGRNSTAYAQKIYNINIT
ncbi:sensor domain-containing diguanylate cyclase [candidate division WOR-3 bacterium]|nr:sensor domain-containing diguanylate cyclase [candidate division WOR-3 bacterium]